MTLLQKQIRKLGIIGISPLASGFDSMQENGIRLSRNVRNLFFSTAEEFMPCTRIRQSALFGYERYKDIYGDIVEYKNFFSTKDKSALILHDPTIFALNALKETGKEMQGVLSAPHIIRVSTGGIKPLEKVKYFYEVPSFHFMCSLDRAEEGRHVLEKFSKSLLQKIFSNFGLNPIARNVTHYADWSLLAEVSVGETPIFLHHFLTLWQIFGTVVS